MARMKTIRETKRRLTGGSSRPHRRFGWTLRRDHYRVWEGKGKGALTRRSGDAALLRGASDQSDLLGGAGDGGREEEERGADQPG